MKRQVPLTKLLPFLLLLAAAIGSCRKNSFINSSNALIRFSQDTLYFDTVFTTTGSITQAVRIYNSNEQKLKLTDIKLMGGSNSSFSINIDGSPGPVQQNIDLEAGDSLYVFVTVRINQGSAPLPFIIQDSIQVSFNGNQEYIQLQAWGQNAHFLNNAVITGKTVWDNSLPYVILGGLRVDTNATLTIGQGSRIYFHANAPLLVDGSLQVNGDKYDSTRVSFLGDRLDEPYRDFPGSWPGIIFRTTSSANLLQYASIRNAYQAVVVNGPSPVAGPKLVMQQCLIDNSLNAGLLGMQTSIEATNCLISNCGNNIVLMNGGNYQFDYCTVASYSNSFIAHVSPVLSLSNAGTTGASPSDLQAVFTNCIFWGNYGTVKNEVQVTKQGTTQFSINFSNCLWKTANNPTNTDTTHMIVNVDPQFDSISTYNNYYDFHLKASSPAIGQGINTGVLIDLDGNPRTTAPTDLGCFQHQ